MPSTNTGAAARDTSITSLLLRPILVLAFALLHVIYQAVLFVGQAKNAMKSVAKRRSRRPPASFTCLEDLLAAHECPVDAIRIPTHLAVVLIDAQPSSIRLYLSRLFARRDASIPSCDIWHGFRSEFQTAVQAKHCSDTAAIIHLARISGVQQLSIYTCQPMPTSALQSVRRTLQAGYRTKAIVPQLKEELDEGVATSAASWPSRYDELRKRGRSKGASRDSCSHESDSSSPASPASSDSEATPSSLDDETLASSYTADHADALPDDATVHIRIGLESNQSAAEETSSLGPGLQVTLLSQHDGQQRFASLVSADMRTRLSTYLSTTILPDLTTCLSTNARISASTLRKSWVAQRDALTSDLSVAALDQALSAAGYLTEPDLLVVFGSPTAHVRQLYGFPAWPLRVTDLFYDGETRRGKDAGYAARVFVKALCKLGKMEQRYGR